MKKVLYSALAVSCAIAGVAATKATAHTARFSTNFHFKPALPSGSPTATQLTTTSNWTIVSTNTCTGNKVVCNVVPTGTTVTTPLQLAAAIRAAGGVIPAGYTISQKLYGVN